MQAEGSSIPSDHVGSHEQGELAPSKLWPLVPWSLSAGPCTTAEWLGVREWWWKLWEWGKGGGTGGSYFSLGRECKKLSSQLLSTSCISELMIRSEGHHGREACSIIYVCSLPSSREDLRQPPHHHHHSKLTHSLCLWGEAEFHFSPGRAAWWRCLAADQRHLVQPGEGALEQLCGEPVHRQAAEPLSIRSRAA